MTMTLDDRLLILQDVSKAWLDLLKATRQLSDEQLLAPGTVGVWSVKDVMGHVSFWEQHLIDTIIALDAGNESDGIEDFEAANLEAAAEAESLTLGEIREEFASTHEELMLHLEQTPSLSRDLIEGATYGHYIEHTADIRAAKK
jgi:uncharacterized damage-inducible protein DinB